LLAAILESAAQLRGVLFDMPYVVEQARTAPNLASFAARFIPMPAPQSILEATPA
jgi:hypothetical protein